MNILVKPKLVYGEYASPPDEKDIEEELLYHYCSMDAFFNIVKSGKIRMGDLKAMNDPSEMLLQEVDVGQAILQEYRKNPFDFDIGEKGFHYGMEEFMLPSIMEYKIGQCGKHNNLLFAFCLSTKSNDLSQWRLYGDNGKGVCLGFKRSQIEQFVKGNSSYSLERVEYFDTIGDVVSTIANETLVTMKKLYENGEVDKLKDFRFDFIRGLPNLWPKYKVKDYQSEDEVRLVYKFNNSQICSNTSAKNIRKEDFNDIDVKVKNGELVLYKELPIKELGLTSITLGPVNNTMKDGINIFLSKNDIVDVDAKNIYKSLIPYRG